MDMLVRPGILIQAGVRICQVYECNENKAVILQGKIVLQRMSMKDSFDHMENISIDTTDTLLRLMYQRNSI